MESVPTTGATQKATTKRKTFFSFLPRLGSKEKMNTPGEGTTSPLSLSRSNSKEEMPGGEGIMPVFEDFEEKVDDELFPDRTPTSSPTSSVPGTPKGKKTKEKKNKAAMKLRPGSKEKMWTLENSLDMERLETAISGKESRRNMIEALVSLHSDLSVKVRFVSAVDEFLAAEGKDRKEKATHIVNVFIKKTSMFHLNGIPAQYEHALLAHKFDSLESLRTIFLNEMVHNEFMVKTVDEVLS